MYDELIKRLRERSVFLFPHHGESRSYDADLMHEAADAIEGLSHAVDQMTEWRKNRWIPVTERLPDEIEDVLVYGEWTGASGTKYREIWLTDLKSFLHQGYKLIAWMPLPEPPKEE